MILELAEAKLKLEQRFAILEKGIDISDLLLRESRMTISQLKSVEYSLGIELPDSFKRVNIKYDFGNLSLGAIFFGNGPKGDNYGVWLIEKNVGTQEYPWWGKGEQPNNKIKIAGTDAYAILLDIDTGAVLAFLRDEDWHKNEQIAQNFELFVRGAITIYCEEDSIQDKVDYANKIKNAVGCTSATKFWKDLTQGFA